MCALVVPAHAVFSDCHESLLPEGGDTFNVSGTMYISTCLADDCESIHLESITEAECAAIGTHLGMTMVDATAEPYGAAGCVWSIAYGGNEIQWNGPTVGSTPLNRVTPICRLPAERHLTIKEFQQSQCNDIGFTIAESDDQQGCRQTTPNDNWFGTSSFCNGGDSATTNGTVYVLTCSESPTCPNDGVLDDITSEEECSNVREMFWSNNPPDHGNTTGNSGRKGCIVSKDRGNVFFLENVDTSVDKPATNYHNACVYTPPPVEPSTSLTSNEATLCVDKPQSTTDSDGKCQPSDVTRAAFGSGDFCQVGDTITVNDKTYVIMCTQGDGRRVPTCSNLDVDFALTDVATEQECADIHSAYGTPQALITFQDFGYEGCYTRGDKGWVYWQDNSTQPITTSEVFNLICRYIGEPTFATCSECGQGLGTIDKMDENFIHKPKFEVINSLEYKKDGDQCGMYTYVNKYILN